MAKTLTVLSRKPYKPMPTGVVIDNRLIVLDTQFAGGANPRFRAPNTPVVIALPDEGDDAPPADTAFELAHLCAGTAYGRLVVTYLHDNGDMTWDLRAALFAKQGASPAPPTAPPPSGVPSGPASDCAINAVGEVIWRGMNLGGIAGGAFQAVYSGEKVVVIGPGRDGLFYWRVSRDGGKTFETWRAL